MVWDTVNLLPFLHHRCKQDICKTRSHQEFWRIIQNGPRQKKPKIPRSKSKEQQHGHAYGVTFRCTAHGVFLHALYSLAFNVIQRDPVENWKSTVSVCILVSTAHIVQSSGAPSCFSLSVASREATQWRSMLGFREDQFFESFCHVLGTLVSMLVGSSWLLLLLLLLVGSANMWKQPCPWTFAPRCKLVCGRLRSRWRHWLPRFLIRYSHCDVC